MKIMYSKASVNMSKVRSRNGETDLIGTLIINESGLQIEIEHFADIGKAFGITTHKLLCAGLVWFTKSNNIGDDSDNIQTTVKIPLREYALLCGYNTKVQNEADKERAKNLLKFVRKQVAKDLKLLLNSRRFTWVETTQGKKERYDMKVLTNAEIKSGCICMTFSQSFAKYLKHRRMTVFPEQLFAIDSRKANAYRIGQALAFHYHNRNNQRDGNANKLKVRTLLTYTCLPSIETVRKERNGNWKSRIKEPLEKALTELVNRNILTGWEYRATGATTPLSAEEVKNQTFDEWANNVIYFTFPEDKLSQNVQAEQHTPEKEKSLTIQVIPDKNDRSDKPARKKSADNKPKDKKQTSFYRKKTSYTISEHRKE